MDKKINAYIPEDKNKSGPNFGSKPDDMDLKLWARIYRDTGIWLYQGTKEEAFKETKYSFDLNQLFEDEEIQNT